MKSIGIITFHKPINYGAILQTVALFKTITANGAQCDIIDYKNDSFERAYKVFSLKRCTSVKLFIWNVINIPNNLKKKKKFKEFLRKNVHLTKPVNKANIKDYSDVYDFYITGSDQVWNYLCTGNDSVFFLDFVLNDRKKGSYAASFGDYEISEDNKSAISKYLSSFEYISVREKSSIKKVEQILGKDLVCNQHLDPTLLVKKTEWEKMIASIKRIHLNEYILIYFMAQNDIIVREMMLLAQGLKQQYGYDIVIIGGSIHKSKNGIYYYNAYSPEEFVALFRDASYVVTNSFHGTAFSVNFNKNFYAYVKNVNANGRVSDFLKDIGLQDRTFSSANSITEYINIQYDEPNKALNDLIDKSVRYLNKLTH